MDPNANLTRQREIVARIVEGESQDGDLEELADLAEALDEWLSKGGFLPARWQRGRK